MKYTNLNMFFSRILQSGNIFYPKNTCVWTLFLCILGFHHKAAIRNAILSQSCDKKHLSKFSAKIFCFMFPFFFHYSRNFSNSNRTSGHWCQKPSPKRAQSQSCGMWQALSADCQLSLKSSSQSIRIYSIYKIFVDICETVSLETGPLRSETQCLLMTSAERALRSSPAIEAKPSFS